MDGYKNWFKIQPGWVFPQVNRICTRVEVEPSTELAGQQTVSVANTTAAKRTRMEVIVDWDTFCDCGWQVERLCDVIPSV